MYVYLWFLILFFALPLAFVAWIAFPRLSRYPRTIVWSLVFTFTLGAVWDWLSVRTGVWRYDSSPTIGFWLDGLPVEELVGFYVLATLLIVGVVLLLLERPMKGRAEGDVR